METNLSAFIQNLLHCVTNAHLLHLQSTSYAQHMALGAFYEGLEDLTDSLAETIQGKYGLLTGYNTNYDLPPSDPVTFLEMLAHIVTGKQIGRAHV